MWEAVHWTGRARRFTIRIASKSAGALQSGVTVVVASLQMIYDGFSSKCSCARGERPLKGSPVTILAAQAQADWEKRCWSLNLPLVPSASLEEAEKAPPTSHWQRQSLPHTGNRCAEGTFDFVRPPGDVLTDSRKERIYSGANSVILNQARCSAKPWKVYSNEGYCDWVQPFLTTLLHLVVPPDNSNLNIALSFARLRSCL